MNKTWIARFAALGLAVAAPICTANGEPEPLLADGGDFVITNQQIADGGDFVVTNGVA